MKTVVWLAGTGVNWKIYDNEIEGTDGADVLTGTEENDEFYGSPGADAIRGGSGNDNVSYLDSDTGIEVRLYDGTARGGYAEGDMFPGRQTIEYQDSQGRTQQAVVPDIENLSGSEHDDILIGDPGGNELNGNGGDDRIEGREGDDRLFGDDWFLIRFSSSTPGDDYLDGGREMTGLTVVVALTNSGVDQVMIRRLTGIRGITWG